MSLFLRLFLLFFFSANVFAIDANIKWTEVSRKDGIIIYNADADAQSGVVPIRFRSIIPYSLPKVLAVLDDSERKIEWVPNMKEAKTIYRKSLTEKIEYSRYHSPWPFKDRTFLVRSKAKINRKTKEIIIDVKSIEDNRAPLNQNFVRGNTKLGEVFVRQLEPKRTVIEMSFLTDFKGNIPVWIINLVQTKWPYKLMKGLVVQLKKDNIIIPKEFLENQ